MYVYKQTDVIMDTTGLLPVLFMSEMHERPTSLFTTLNVLNANLSASATFILVINLNYEQHFLNQCRMD